MINLLLKSPHIVIIQRWSGPYRGVGIAKIVKRGPSWAPWLSTENQKKGVCLDPNPRHHFLGAPLFSSFSPILTFSLLTTSPSWLHVSSFLLVIMRDIFLIFIFYVIKLNNFISNTSMYCTYIYNHQLNCVPIWITQQTNYKKN